MKRIVSMLLAIAMVLALAACGSGSTTAAPTEAPATPAESTPAAQTAQTSAEKTLRVWVSKMFSDEVNAALEERALAYGAEKGVKVELERLAAGDITNVVNAAVEAGANVLPDLIMWSSYDKFMYYYPDLVNIPVTDLFNELNEAHPFLGARKDGSTIIDGEQYAIPFYASCALLAIRKSAMEAAGYTEVPTTWDGIFEMAEKITEATGMYGLGWGCGPNDEDCENNSRTYLWGYDAFQLSENGINSSDKYKEFAERYVDLYNKGVIPVDATTWGPSGNNNSYLIGESAIVWNAATLVRALANDQPDLYADSIFVAAPAGDVSHQRDSTACWTVTKGAEDPELAKDFIRWMMDYDWYGSFLQGCVPVLTPVYQEVADSDFWRNDSTNAANVETAEAMDVFLSHSSTDPQMMSVGMKLFQSYAWSNLLSAMCNGATFEEAWPTFESTVNEIVASSYGN